MRHIFNDRIFKKTFSNNGSSLQTLALETSHLQTLKQDCELSLAPRLQGEGSLAHHRSGSTEIGPCANMEEKVALDKDGKEHWRSSSQVQLISITKDNRVTEG